MYFNLKEIENQDYNHSLNIIKSEGYDINKNGRINIKDNEQESGTAVFLQDRIPNNHNTNFNNFYNIGTGIFEKNNLEGLFFHPKNINTIQNDIKAGVYKRTGNKYVISNQSPDVLNMIMRDIFESYSLNLKNQIKEQLEALNKLVVDHCVPKITNEVIAYMNYRRDVSQLAVPMSHPKSTDYNNTSLEFKTFF